MIADAIQNRLSDPRILPITSITRVEVSPDMSVARVYVSALSDNPSKRALCVEALQNAAGRLRRMLGPELHLRTVPNLAFELDDSLRVGYETIEAIDRAMEELGEIPEWKRVDEDDLDAPPESPGDAERHAAEEDS